MPTRKPLSIPWIGVVVLAVLIGGYVGTYYVSVDRNYVSKVIEPTYFVPDHIGTNEDYENWRRSNGRWKMYFAPVHWLDRRIRPHVWEPTP